MHSQISLALAFLLLTLLNLAVPAQANEESADSHKAIIIGSPSEGWPPFVIVEKKPNQHRGIMIDVFRAIAEPMGYDVTFSFFPDKRGIMMLQEGEVQAYPKAKEWVEDPSQFLWSNPVVSSTDTLVSLRAHSIEFDSIHSLTRRSVGTVHGFRYPSLQDAFTNETIHHYTTNDTNALLHMLKRGHVEAVITNRHVAEWIISKDPALKLNIFAFSANAIDIAPYRFAFTKAPQWEKFLSRFNEELAKMKADGRLKAILDHYR